VQHRLNDDRGTVRRRRATVWFTPTWRRAPRTAGSTRKLTALLRTTLRLRTPLWMTPHLIESTILTQSWQTLLQAVLLRMTPPPGTTPAPTTTQPWTTRPQSTLATTLPPHNTPFGMTPVLMKVTTGVPISTGACTILPLGSWVRVRTQQA